MATDTWTYDGTANWNTASDWSDGVPGSSSDVVINQGNPEVTASFGTVDSISIANSATPTSLTFINAGASTVAGDVTNSGELYVDRLSGDGGSTLAIDGMLTNNGGIDIGPADNSLSAASTVEAAGLGNAGTIRLYGSSTAEATLDVASAAGTGAAGTLDGEIDLYGDALVEFASGEISTIQPGSLLYLWGPDAFVADASATSSNSALAGLTTNKGLLDLQDGASVMTSGGLSNRGAIELDYPWGQVGVGGSSLAIGGTLTNDGTIRIGDSSTVDAQGIVNFIGPQQGTIELYGFSAEATLDVASAAGFGAAGTLYGGVSLSGYARIEFASGQIKTIAGTLSLSGEDSVVADADAANQSWNSALVGLDTVAGNLVLNGGAVVTTDALTNTGTIGLDYFGPTDSGGSFLNVLETLTNDGTIEISTAGLARDEVEAGSIVNDGAIDLYGDGSNTVRATLDTTGSFVNDGSVNVSDDYDKLVGAISGTGNIGLSAGASLDFAGSVASGETVTFGGGAPDLLTLNDGSSFDGTIEDFFGDGDGVDLTNFAYATTTFQYTQTGADSASWTLTDGANTAVLNFAGEPYVRSDFSIVSANGGAGSAIKFV
jgi:hypothetical protein